jgi:peroxiredoxin
MVPLEQFQRYALVAEEGKVVTIAVEAEASDITVASAKTMLAEL